jgi:hypothetical protein
MVGFEELGKRVVSVFPLSTNPNDLRVGSINSLGKIKGY